MTAVQEDSIDLSAEADIAVVKRLLLLLKEVCEFVNLFLEHDNFLAQKGIVLPLDLCLTSAVDWLKKRRRRIG